MYNRYIPQPDGSFRRCHHPDRTPPQRPPAQHRPEPKQEPVKEAPHPSPKQESKPSYPPPKEEIQPKKQEHSGPPKSQQGQSITDFLRHLLPKDFDTADLLIVLLLLLMAGDSQEDQNHALLTLVLYLFM